MSIFGLLLKNEYTQLSELSLLYFNLLPKQYPFSSSIYGKFLVCLETFLSPANRVRLVWCFPIEHEDVDH